ncbi:MAG: PQQ-binding-like beta-propeller repeat protein [Bryobacterales bacterium]|nr:PQQ-binding-like beta-propeller repeat protein [Bryobacterales bacterium]MBV9401177.1 PQQ-binding-like beta-propeller repeat protein [Bryobacterales bacterium]
METRIIVFGLAAAGFLLHAQDGAKLYSESCAMCHDGGEGRAPARDALRSMTPERVLAALETGPMISMAVRRSAAERRAIAEYVTGKSFSAKLDVGPKPEAMCKGESAFDPAAAPGWNAWGVNTSNTRFQSAAGAGITGAQAPRLKVKWAFGFPGDLQAYAQPVVMGGRVFTGSQGGKVYSLSAATGCVYWYFETAAGVRAAISIGRLPRGYTAFFGDQSANVYAVDAATGALVWKTKADDFPVARVTGSPTFYNGRLYVPVASGEEAAGSVPDYECCRFRGNLVALDAATGKQIWKTYAVDEPKRTKKNKNGTQLWGPSGAPIWSSPAIDPQRNAVYVTTGDNYSDPATRMSDAFIAMDLNSGKILWSRQMTAADAYTSACRLPDKTNCPDSNGPDLDFSSSPILVTLANGKRALVAGQKSGVVHAIDPDQQGEVLWQVRIGKGGTMGGVQWGSATDGSNVYVALSDIGRIMLTYSQNTDADPKQGGGMFALRLSDGKQVWHTPPASCGNKPRCSPAQSAAVSAIPGVAFSGSVDGHLRAYSVADGKVIWDFDTAQSYKTVNGVEARGGSLDGPGPAIAGGMLFLSSGYPTAGGMPGNVLLAFSVDGK